MRTVLALVMAVSFAAGTLSVASAADEKKMNSQQERMKACNSQAGDKKGDERKAFMSVLDGRRGDADDSAGQNEAVQRRRERQVPQGGRAQGVYEHLRQGRQEDVGWPYPGATAVPGNRPKGRGRPLEATPSGSTCPPPESALLGYFTGTVRGGPSGPTWNNTNLSRAELLAFFMIMGFPGSW